MNKVTLAAILGTALLGLTKKGSSARKIPLDDYFKKKVRNKDQTFKIYLTAYYPAIVIDTGYGGSEIEILSNFKDEIEEYISYIKEVVEGFRSYLESGVVSTTNGEDYFYVDDVDPQGGEDLLYHEDQLYDIQDIFRYWVVDNDIEWNGEPAILRGLSGWEIDYLLLSKSKFHFSFPKDTSDYKIRDEIREDNVEEMRSWIRGGYLDQNIDEDWKTEVFVQKLYKQGSIGRYEWENDGDYFDDENFIELLTEISWNAKSDLLDLLDNWEWDLYQPDDGFINWEEYMNPDVGIVLECRLDLETMNIRLNQWHLFVQRVISAAYEKFRVENNLPSFSIALNRIPVLRVKPNIWEQKKSKLRKR